MFDGEIEAEKVILVAAEKANTDAVLPGKYRYSVC
jgi:hypothetical protein